MRVTQIVLLIGNLHRTRQYELARLDQAGLYWSLFPPAVCCSPAFGSRISQILANCCQRVVYWRYVRSRRCSNITVDNTGSSDSLYKALSSKTYYKDTLDGAYLRFGRSKSLGLFASRLFQWFALKFPAAAIYFDTLRECYEAYVIYNFLAFLLNYLRHEYPDIIYLVEQKPQVKHLPPLCCCKDWTMGRRFIDHCRHGALQYTVIRPITTVIALICDQLGVYGEGDFNFHQAFLYLTIINNISQVWALYCLILFYQCTKEELRPMSPVSKFLCVKFVVFMSFWQSILIFILAVTGVFKDVKIWEMHDVKSIGIVLQNFAICIEMFFAALAHHFSFSHQPYVDPDAAEVNCCTSWWSMWDVSDMRRDVFEHVRHVGEFVLIDVRAFSCLDDANLGFRSGARLLMHFS
ncbi:hypothetical protein P879_07265 [Paragonimus westermani]|uniref:Transmembrane protein 184C n=1 Tax=Paragonimus westermani TaxID=34504 RepID=A0A8T0DMR9_9TREM|nr:hypothetical protein P879_07265 [Paragonimus westermani]